MKTAIFSFFLSVTLCLANACAAGMDGRNLASYAREMEFFYKVNDLDSLPGIISGLDKANAFAHGEKRLLVAAFLAEIIRNNSGARKKVMKLSANVSRYARHMLAWALHLSGTPDAQVKNDLLSHRDDLGLLSQIESTSRDLADWNLYSEPSVLQMYWGAFMGGGKNLYLDSIIEAALRYARLNEAGRQKDADFAVCAKAAASLYELAPRHPVIIKRISEKLKGLSGAEAKTLRMILRK